MSNRNRTLWQGSLVIVLFALVLLAACRGQTPDPTPTPPPTATAAPTAPATKSEPPSQVAPSPAIPATIPTEVAGPRVRPTATPGRAAGLGAASFARATEPLAVLSTYPQANAEEIPIGSATCQTPKPLTGLPTPAAQPQQNPNQSQISNLQAPETADPCPRIVVQFNHPVVPLAGLAERTTQANPLTLNPAAPGKGEWLNTSTYVFYPDRLAPSTKYTVTVAALSDLVGAKLDAPVSFSFTTVLPGVARSLPRENAQLVPINQPIRVSFNQPMNQAEAEAAFSLRPQGGQPVQGVFSWEGNTLIFTPAQPLAHNVTYTAQVKAGAKDAQGKEAIRADKSWTFQSEPAPGLAASQPANGATNYQGGIQLTFASPMDRDNVQITVEPKLSNSNLFWQDETNTKVSLGGPLAPSTPYTVTIKGESKTRSGFAVGRDITIRFTTGPDYPRYQLGYQGQVAMFDANRAPTLSIASVNIDQFTMRLSRLPATELYRMLGPNGWQVMNNYQTPANLMVREWTARPGGALNTTTVTTETLTAGGATLPSGAYMLMVTGPALRQGGPPEVTRQIVIVSLLNLMLKRTDREALVWATDLQTGQPSAGIPIKLRTANGQTLAEGITNNDGLFRVQFDPLKDVYQSIWAVSESRGEVIAAVGSDWGDNIRPYFFGIDHSLHLQDYTAQVYTDRPLYRPGDKVYFRGILRQGRDGAYTVPVLDTVTVRVQSQGAPLYEKALKLTSYGSFADEFSLPQGAPLGYYEIVLKIGDDTKPDQTLPAFYASAQFQVAEYRKPEFEATVTPDKVDYVNGDTINVTVDTAYFFGGPVKDANITWRVQTEDYFFSQPETLKGFWEFTDFDALIDRRRTSPFGRRDQTPPGRSGTGKTDSQGKFTFQVSANLIDHPASQTFSVEAEITDQSGQAISARRAVPVHRGAFYIGLRPRAYMGLARQAQTLDAIVLDTKGISVTNQALTVNVYRREWESVRDKDMFGNLYWTSKPNDTLITTLPATTNAQGLATLTYTPPQAGTYRMVAEGKDTKGNAVRSAVYQWITGQDQVSWRQSGQDRFDLVTDKKSYSVGDTAKILVSVPFAPAEALMTIERGDIREVKRLSLKGLSETVDVPIPGDYIPNIYVSVAAVKGGDANTLPRFSMSYVNLNVSTSAKVLDVKLTPDKPGPAQPGQSVTYNLEVKDATGKPVQAEFSLALVDKAIFSLADDKTLTPEKVFYSQRVLGVDTGATMSRNLNRLTAQLMSGGGGGGGGGFAPDFSLRSDFRDTAFWKANVVTDATGKAKVDVKLPDNLTTWMLTALGTTQDTLVGYARIETVATKTLLVRPALPRFLIQGDVVRLAAVVQNNSNAAINGRVTVQTQGLDGKLDPIQVNLPANGSARVDWDVVVGNVDEATVTFAAEGGALRDAAQLKLPVYRAATPETVGTAGIVSERVDEVIRVPSNAAPGLGGLTVNINPSLAAVTADGLRYLDSSEYDSCESIISHLVPSVASIRMAQAMNLPINREAINIMVNRDLQKLFRRQNPDGGWGWFEGEPSNPFLTAYGVLGLQTARQAGFTFEPGNLERALNFLREQVNKPLEAGAPGVMSQRAFILYVLAEADSPDLAKTMALYNQRNDMSLYGQAYVLLTLQRIDARGQAQRIQTLAQNFAALAKLGPTGAFWEESVPNPKTLNTDVRTTATILLALSRVNPKDASLPNVARWLMATRGSNGAWRSTQETAWAILALTDYMVGRGDTASAYRYTVNLNGKDLKSADVSVANLAEAQRLYEDIKNLVTNAGNNLTISKTGQGDLYYTAHLTYYPRADEVQALDKGILVGRQYIAVDPLTLQSTGQEAKGVKIGDYVQVKVTLVARNSLHYVIVEDPLPAGFEAVDVSLKTSSQAARRPQLAKGVMVEQDPALISALRGGAAWDVPFWAYWAHSEVRDSKVAVFATELPPGVYEYTYLMRASAAGQFRALPTTAYEMYFPETFGRSASALFPVAPVE